MTSRIASESAERVTSTLARLDALERRLDELEDLMEAAWDEHAAPAPRRTEEPEGDAPTRGQRL
jgi:hypothetical protein